MDRMLLVKQDLMNMLFPSIKIQHGKKIFIICFGIMALKTTFIFFCNFLLYFQDLKLLHKWAIHNNKLMNQ